jgi:regulator of sigma D
MNEKKMTITEWLNERIEFIQGVLDMTKDENQKGQFNSALSNFLLCKDLYDYLSASDPKEAEYVIIQFKQVAGRLITESIKALDEEIDAIHPSTESKEMFKMVYSMHKRREGLVDIQRQINEF